jgi:hypothetical protein
MGFPSGFGRRGLTIERFGHIRIELRRFPKRRDSLRQSQRTRGDERQYASELIILPSVKASPGCLNFTGSVNGSRAA